MLRITAIGMICAGFLLAAGCQKPLNIEQKYSIGAGDVRSLSIDGPAKDQNVTVTVSSSQDPVDVYIVEEAQVDATRNMLLDRKKPQNTLAQKEKMKEGSLDVKISKGTPFSVVFGGATRDTEVVIKIAGK